jgi:hypothetical protein
MTSEEQLWEPAEDRGAVRRRHHARRTSGSVISAHANQGPARAAQRTARSVELQFSLADPWSRQLFLALARRYGLRCIATHASAGPRSCSRRRRPSCVTSPVAGVRGAQRGPGRVPRRGDGAHLPRSSPPRRAGYRRTACCCKVGCYATKSEHAMLAGQPGPVARQGHLG